MTDARVCACACLAPQDAFTLTYCFIGEHPPLFSSTSQLTAGRYPQESIEMKREAWIRHVSWRLEIFTAGYIDDLRSAESRAQHSSRLHPREEPIVTSRLQSHLQTIERWRQCISTTRQRNEEQRCRGYDAVDLCRRAMLQFEPSADGLTLH